MDGEHAFSAAIILVMINIAFPYNERDRAAMELALDVLNSMAEKGNSHIGSLHQLLLKLYRIVAAPKATSEIYDGGGGGGSSTALGQAQTPLLSSSTVSTATAAASALPVPPPLTEDPFAAFLAAQQSAHQLNIANENGEGLSTVPEELLSLENQTGDARLWEDGYETFSMGVDFDWSQWTS